MKSAALLAAACITAALTSAAWAQGFKPTLKSTDAELSFEGGTGLSNYILSVTGPNGFSASISSRTTIPSLDLRKVGGFDDGVYHYEITAMTGEKVPVRTQLYDFTATNGEKALVKGYLDNGRDGAAADSMPRSISASGVFHVAGGTITKFDPAAREPENAKRLERK